MAADKANSRPVHWRSFCQFAVRIVVWRSLKYCVTRTHTHTHAQHIAAAVWRSVSRHTHAAQCKAAIERMCVVEIFRCVHMAAALKVSDRLGRHASGAQEKVMQQIRFEGRHFEKFSSRSQKLPVSNDIILSPSLFSLPVSAKCPILTICSNALCSFWHELSWWTIKSIGNWIFNVSHANVTACVWACVRHTELICKRELFPARFYLPIYSNDPMRTRSNTQFNAFNSCCTIHDI